MTAEGKAFLPFARRPLESEEEGRAVLAASDAVSGLLRVTAPVAFGRGIVAPMVPAPLRAHPALRIDLSLSDQVVDIVGAGFDPAIRIGKPRDSRLIAKRLSDNSRLLRASPKHSRDFGTPDSPEELERRECLTLSATTHWAFLVAGGERRVRVGGRFSCDGIEGSRAGALAGGGVALLAEWNIRDDLRRGSLVAFSIEGATIAETAIWAVHPAAAMAPPAIARFHRRAGGGAARMTRGSFRGLSSNRVTTSPRVKVTYGGIIAK